RPVIWTMGSTPALRMITAAATAAIATIARFESVTLTASTKPLRASARRRTTVADALFGGLSSAVTMKPLPRRRSASALNEKDLSFSMRGLPVRSTPLIFPRRSEEHTSELQSRGHLVCRLLLEKKKKQKSQ